MPHILNLQNGWWRSGIKLVNFSQEKRKQMQNQPNKADEALLQKFGYAQELYREMGGFSNFAISFSIISILTGLVALYGYGVAQVGAACYWTWVVVAFFQLFNALAMGEIASSFPLAGGVYQWARRLGNPHLGWWTGWINLIGWWAVTVAIDFALATFLASSGWFGLTKTTSTTVLLTLAIMTIHMFMNIFGIKLVAWFNNFSVWVHMIGTIMLFSLLLYFGKARPLSFIFDTNGHGTAFCSLDFWKAFLPAILMSAWTLTAFDASADVSEETEDPQHHVPWGMVIAVIASFIFGSLVLLGLNLALPPYDVLAKAMEKTTATIYIIQQVMAPALALVMMAIIVLAQFACGLSSMTVYQRIIYALARDNNLPLSPLLKKVHPKYKSPYWATIIGTFCMAIFTALASVLETITSVATLGLYFSYFIVIVIAVIARKNGKWGELGPWNLGKHGLWIACIAIVWNLAISIGVSLPNNGITLKIFLGIMLALAIYYFASMRNLLKVQQSAISSDELEKLKHATAKVQ
jgi:amino acid transporter